MAFIHKGKTIKSVGFFGFGKSNRAVYKYLNENHPDLSFTVRVSSNEKDLPENAIIFKGENVFKNLYEDLIFVSPSVRRDKREFRAKLLSSDAELFFEKNTHDVFAVTGSDGKSTTTTLTKKLLEGGYKESFAVGNIGVPFSSMINYHGSCAFAAELSSFQLMNFAPQSRRALITNITPNHLDWHSSYEEYISAKENALKNTKEAVLYIEDNLSLTLAKRYTPYAIASIKLTESDIKKYNAQTYVYIKNDAIYVNGEEFIKRTDILRNETCNLKNFVSAIALCYGFFDKSKLLEVAQSFSGLPHRFELVMGNSGYKVYNSSIDTSPQRSFSTLSSKNGEYVLIMGGRTKMKNFEILRNLIEKNAHALVLTGENRYEIYEKLKPISTSVYLEENFNSAVKLAQALADNKCDIIFSPASTSFDAFENFEKRGEAFKLALRSTEKGF